MSQEEKEPMGSPAPDEAGFLKIVSWIMVVAGSAAMLGSGGCILLSAGSDGGLALLLGGPPFLFGLGAVYVSWNLLKRLRS